MEVLGEMIKIWKKMPKEFIFQRKKFRVLTEKLIQEKNKVQVGNPKGTKVFL